MQMSAEMITATAEGIVALGFLGGVVFHAGYVYSSLNWLKENAATKADLEVLRGRAREDIDGRLKDYGGPQNKVDVQLCNERHIQMSKQCDNRNDLVLQRLEGLEESVRALTAARRGHSD